MRYKGSEKLSNEKIKKIHSALVGGSIAAAQFAIKECAVYGLKDEQCIAALKALKNDSAVDIVKISELAEAALDILGIEKYDGENALVNELIKTKFYTIATT